MGDRGIEINLASEGIDVWHRFIYRGLLPSQDVLTVATENADRGRWLPLVPWDQFGTPARTLLVNPAHVRAMRLAHPEDDPDG